MSNLVDELKYSLRSIRRRWRFSLGVVLTLALGIGANTLVYSIVDSVVLNPFPFPDPGRLVGVGSEWPHLSRDFGFFETLSPAEYLDVTGQTETLDRVVMWDMGYRSVSTSASTGIERAEMLLTGSWFEDVFPTLGVAPILGRGFNREELEHGRAVAVVSHRLWQAQLGGDPDALGQVLQVDGEPYELIGVMSPGSQILGSDLWIPMAAGPERFSRDARRMQILARIKPGYSLQEVNTELALISGRIEQEHGAEFEEYRDWRMRAMTWTEINVRLVRPAAIGVMSLVAFVLLIVCANVGNLMVAQSTSRQRENAVRSALGASRGRMVGQLLSESLILSALAAALAVVLTQTIVSTLLPRLVARIPFVVVDVSINLRVLSFTALAALLTGAGLGLITAVGSSRSRLEAQGARATGGVHRRRLQRVFVGSQFAIALLLLTQAGLMANSLVRMHNVDVGFDTSESLTMRLTLPQHRYPDRTSIDAFFEQLIDRVEALPGVRRAGAGTQYPPIFFPRRNPFEIQGAVYGDGAERPRALLTSITHGYPEALGIPIVAGRSFNEHDRLGVPPVALVNQAAARQLFPDQRVIGQRFRLDRQQPWIEVVGVVRSVHNLGPEQEPQPELFLNVRQFEAVSNQLFLVVGAESDSRSLLEPVRAEVEALDPEQAIYAVATVAEAFEALTAPRRLGTLVVMLFAAFALALAASGIYGVVAMGVAGRRREIGLRLALGATPPAVSRLVVRQTMWPVLSGGAVGLLLALGGGRAMSSFLFGVSASDPMTLLATILVLLASATTAGYLPARRASRLDPTAALRAD